MLCTSPIYGVSLLILCLVYVVFVVVTIDALPDGAPVCTSGTAAPGEPHYLPEVGKVIATGTLESAGFIVTIDGVTLEPGVTIDVPAYEDIQVVMTSTSGIQPFKGALLVVSKEGVDTRGVFSDVGLNGLQLNLICELDGNTKSGVTHTSRVTKTTVGATMRFTLNNPDLLFDANVVVVNNNEESFYYYTGYKFNVIGATSPPTDAPRRRGCGLFGFSIFCPFRACGIFGRWLYGDDFC